MPDLAARQALGSTARGPALVACENFSVRYDVDLVTGRFARPGHALEGELLAGRILVLNTAKGGVASAWMLRRLVETGLAPLGIAFNSINTILVQGAAFAGLPLLVGFDDDITQAVPNGANVVLDTEARRLRFEI
jgi:hypothetical protein